MTEECLFCGTVMSLDLLKHHVDLCRDEKRFYILDLYMNFKIIILSCSGTGTSSEKDLKLDDTPQAMVETTSIR